MTETGWPDEGARIGSAARLGLGASAIRVRPRPLAPTTFGDCICYISADVHPWLPVPINKGSEVLLAERGLLPQGGLRGACESSKAHTADNRCCCKRLLATLGHTRGTLNEPLYGLF